MNDQTSRVPEGSHGRYAHRPIIWGMQGMVGAGTQLTAQTGMRILWPLSEASRQRSGAGLGS